MYLENSPFSGPPDILKSSDFIVYGYKFEQIVLEQLPTSQKVVFVTEKDLKAVETDLSDSKKRQLITRVFSKKLPVCFNPDTIVMPLNTVDRDDLAAMVVGVDDLVIEKSTTQWLRDSLLLINSEFMRVRHALMDPLTSLYNQSGFRDYLSRAELRGNFHIVLVESLPPAKSVKDAFAHVTETGKLLEEFNRFMLPLFHLGQSVFSYIIVDRDKEFIKFFCHSLTTFFRNSGSKRIHIGFSSYTRKRHKAKSSLKNSTAIVDEAWSALQKAGRRGPYAFCDYELVVNPDIFPLKPISKSTTGKLSYRWKGYQKFALVFLRPDYKDRKNFDEFINTYMGNEIFISDPDGYLVIRPGKGDKSTKKWASSLITKIKNDKGERCLLSAGISSYPFRDYSKTEIIRNCQKALLHGSFFGPGSSVIFDSLSLNVSGDAYFSESDLSGAVREYRKGLEIDDNDINLLNSLGVTYALMSRTTKAVAVFEKVIETVPQDFMAFFNKGLGEKTLKNYAAAIDSFTRALEFFNRKDREEAAVVNDLRFQLGVCLYHEKKYKEYVTVFKKWHKSTKTKTGSEKCFRYIGIGYFYLDNLQQAAQWLQRGLAVDQSDAESLSLLGTVYLKTKEGDDIALKLCEKSVEIDPHNQHYKMRYGRALSTCKHFDAALEIFLFCIRFKTLRGEAWLEIARIYFSQNKLGKSNRYLKKIFNARDIGQITLEKARELDSEVGSMRA